MTFNVRLLLLFNKIGNNYPTIYKLFTYFEIS